MLYNEYIWVALKSIHNLESDVTYRKPIFKTLKTVWVYKTLGGSLFSVRVGCRNMYDRLRCVIMCSVCNDLFVIRMFVMTIGCIVDFN
jgi:hypothetical protein